METIPSDISESVHVKQDSRGRIEATNQKGTRTVVRIETRSSGLHLYSTWEKQPQEPYYTKRQIWLESKGSFQEEIIGDDVIISLGETKLLFPKEFNVNKLSQALSSGLPTPVALFELSRQ